MASGNYEVSQAEIVGMEVSEIPIPKAIEMYESKPLFSYKVFFKYQGRCGRTGREKTRKLKGHCMLTLKTQILNDEDLVLVQGEIGVERYESCFEKRINFVPKEKINCEELYRLIEEFIDQDGHLGNDFFDPDIYGTIQRSLFTCRREVVPMICGYNADGTLDRVSVNMSLFKRV